MDIAALHKRKPEISEWEDVGNIHVSLRASESPRPHHHVIADLAVKYGAVGSYLDLGCGMGDIPLLIRKKDPKARISVADAYEICIEETQKKVKNLVRSYLLPKNEFCPELVINEKFDVVIMSHVLEHLHNPIAGIQSAMRLLNDKGILIIAVPNPTRPEVLVTNVWKRHYVNRGHVFSWDPSHWKNFLERIMRLDVIEYSSDVVSLFPGFLGKIVEKTSGRALAKIVPWWGFSNIAVIRIEFKIRND